MESWTVTFFTAVISRRSDAGEIGFSAVCFDFRNFGNSREPLNDFQVCVPRDDQVEPDAITVCALFEVETGRRDGAGLQYLMDRSERQLKICDDESVAVRFPSLNFVFDE